MVRVPALVDAQDRLADRLRPGGLEQLVPVLAAPLHPRRREPEPEPEPELQLVRVTLVMAVPFICCVRELQVWLQRAILPTKSNSCS